MRKLGDAVRLIDSNGNQVVTYQYNSWGVPVSVTDNSGCNLSMLNPFRYRGYVYDEETGYYYLKSHYYDLESGRFLSADHVDVMLDSRNTPISKNLYAYCENNPIIYVDPLGRAIEWGAVITAAAIGAIIGMVMSLITAAVTGQLDEYGWDDLGAAAFIGAVGGIATPAFTAVVSFGVTTYQSYKDGEKFGTAFLNGLISAGLSFVCAKGLGVKDIDKFTEYTFDIIMGFGIGLTNEGTTMVVNTIEDRPLANSGYIEHFHNNPRVGYTEHFHDGRRGYQEHFHQKQDTGYQTANHKTLGYRTQFHYRMV